MLTADLIDMLGQKYRVIVDDLDERGRRALGGERSVGVGLQR